MIFQANQADYSILTMAVEEPKTERHNAHKKSEGQRCPDTAT